MCDFRLFIFWRALRRHEFLREFYSYWQKRPSWHCRQWSDFFFVNIALRFRAKCHEIVYIWTGTLRLSWTLPVYPSASFLFFKISFMPLLSSSGKEELKKKIYSGLFGWVWWTQDTDNLCKETNSFSLSTTPESRTGVSGEAHRAVRGESFTETSTHSRGRSTYLRPLGALFTCLPAATTERYPAQSRTPFHLAPRGRGNVIDGKGLLHNAWNQTDWHETVCDCERLACSVCFGFCARSLS